MPKNNKFDDPFEPGSSGRFSYSSEFGTIKGYVYCKEDYDPKIAIRPVIADIFEYADCEDDMSIAFITEAIPEGEYTLEHLLDNYTKSSQNAYIMCQAGTLEPGLNAFGTVQKALEHIESEKGYIMNAFFYNIIFNRRMSRSFGNTNICIYDNDVVEDFIDKNMGKGKIINRVESSGKL